MENTAYYRSDRANKYKDRIHLPGYISEEEKKYLMHNACAFVFPSNYEGFGIPIVEAMSCGGIVITADNSSLKEVGGKAAFYVQKQMRCRNWQIEWCSALICQMPKERN